MHFHTKEFFCKATYENEMKPKPKIKSTWIAKQKKKK